MIGRAVGRGKLGYGREDAGAHPIMMVTHDQWEAVRLEATVTAM